QIEGQRQLPGPGGIGNTGRRPNHCRVCCGGWHLVHLPFVPRGLNSIPKPPNCSSMVAARGPYGPSTAYRCDPSPSKANRASVVWNAPETTGLGEPFGNAGT